MFQIRLGFILLVLALASNASPDAIAKLATPALDKLKADSAFLVHMPAGSDVKEGSEQLVRIIEQGDLRGVTMIVGSEDPEVMAEIMKQAFAVVPEGSLKGANVLFVGEKESRREIRRLVKKSGAKFVFVEYQ